MNYLTALKNKKENFINWFWNLSCYFVYALYYLYNVYLNIIYFALAFALVQFTKVNHPLNNRIYRFIKEHKK